MLKIALICTIIGITVLYFISSNIEISESTIDKINKDNIGEDVKLNGRVSDIFESEKVYFIELTQPSKITVLVFKDNKQNLSSLKYKDVEIIGKIDEYKGEIEVIAHRIRVIS